MARGAAERRYAKALFELAQEERRVDDVRREQREFAEVVASSAALREVLLTPLHPMAQRRAVLDAVAERLGTSPLLRNFTAFLVDQRRLLDLAAIRAEYERLADREAGVTRAEVRSASPLSDEQQRRLRAALASRTGGEVELDVSVDPTLLGGIVAKLGDVVFDGSIRTQLAQLRASLTGESRSSS